MKNKMINIRVDVNEYEKFKEYCLKNGFSISKRIRILMKNDINGN